MDELCIMQGTCQKHAFLAGSEKLLIRSETYLSPEQAKKTRRQKENPEDKSFPG
jgi:cytochrome c-type biogenesis protein CcmE